MLQMSMSSMRAILSKQLTVILKAKCHLMEVTFSVLQSFDEITELAGNCAIVYTRYMCSKFFTDKFEVRTYSNGVLYINTKSGSTADSVKLLY